MQAPVLAHHPFLVNAVTEIVSLFVAVAAGGAAVAAAVAVPAVLVAVADERIMTRTERQVLGQSFSFDFPHKVSPQRQVRSETFVAL